MTNSNEEEINQERRVAVEPNSSFGPTTDPDAPQEEISPGANVTAKEQKIEDEEDQLAQTFAPSQDNELPLVTNEHTNLNTT